MQKLILTMPIYGTNLESIENYLGPSVSPGRATHHFVPDYKNVGSERCTNYIVILSVGALAKVCGKWGR